MKNKTFKHKNLRSPYEPLEVLNPKNTIEDLFKQNILKENKRRKTPYSC